MAVKPVDRETWTEVEVGLRETEIGGGAAMTVMAAEADFVPSLIAVALSTTEGGAGTEAGAL